MSFTADLTKFKVKTTRQAEQVCRKISLDVLSRVIRKTPVDTGRARGNWLVEQGNMPTSHDPNVTDTTGANALSEGSSVVKEWDIANVLYLMNNVPYILRLEDGYSKQAPAGMVKLTLREYPGIVENAV